MNDSFRDWRSPDSASAALRRRARGVFVAGHTRQAVWFDPYPPYVERGEGPCVFDVEGNRYVDYTNNLGVLIHGHAHPDIMDAAKAQLERGTCFALPTSAEIALAELLCDRVESFERVRFVNTGSEAVASALKAARAHTGRTRIAKLEGVYHGSYDYAEISNYSSPENWGNDPASVPVNAGTPTGVPDEVVVLPGNDVESTLRILDAHGGEIAAVIVDPVPPRNGMVPLRSEYVSALREWTKRDGALLVYDEVIALRFGYRGAQGRFGGDPDLTAMGKIIGGGFPVGAIAGRADVMQVVADRAQTSGTFSANPVTMTAGLKSMELLTPEAYDRLDANGERVRTRLRGSIERHGAAMQVVGTGSMFSIYPHQRDATRYRNYYRSAAENETVARLHLALMARGVFIAPTCTGFMSTVMGEPEIDALCNAFDDVLAGGISPA